MQRICLSNDLEPSVAHRPTSANFGASRDNRLSRQFRPLRVQKSKTQQWNRQHAMVHYSLTVVSFRFVFNYVNQSNPSLETNSSFHFVFNHANQSNPSFQTNSFLNAPHISHCHTCLCDPVFCPFIPPFFYTLILNMYISNSNLSYH